MIEHETLMSQLTPDVIRAMSPQEAGTKYALLTASYQQSQKPPIVVQPSNAVEAYHKLDDLKGDPRWVDRLNRGEASAVKDFHTLTEMISADGAEAEFAKAGVVPDGYINTGGPNRLTLQDQVAAVRDMLGRGSAPSFVDDIISDKKPTREQHEAGKRGLQMFMANPTLVAALNARNSEAKHLFDDLGWMVGCYEAA